MKIFEMIGTAIPAIGITLLATEKASKVEPVYGVIVSVCGMFATFVLVTAVNHRQDR